MAPRVGGKQGYIRINRTRRHRQVSSIAIPALPPPVALSETSKTAQIDQQPYVLKRWPAPTRYVGDGHNEIDNNPAERALRTVSIGRKNYLFAGSDAGGERAHPRSTA
jgi:hypothetical protein